jgi:carboxylesterase
MFTRRPGSEPTFIRGGETGVLCLHGFAASPAEVRWLAEALSRDGHTVFSPRLAGHGSQYRDLARARASDWFLSARDAFDILSAQCSRVLIAGHSMGGMLALLLAAQPDLKAGGTLAGIAVLAAPLRFSPQIRRRSRWLRAVVPYTDQSDVSDFPAQLRQEQARRQEPVVGRVRYDRWSTRAVYEMTRLADAADAVLGDIKVPALLLYGARDRTAPPEEGERIRDRLSATSSCELRIILESGHILTQDRDHEQVFAMVRAFASEVLALGNA